MLLRKFSNRFALEGSKWPKNELTYRVAKYPMKSNLSPEDVDGEMRAAVDIWEGVTKLKFKKVSGKADIEISFVEGDHRCEERTDGVGKELAHAFFPRYGGDIHMDDEEPWTINSTQGINLLYGFTHELGHSLGLKHSVNVDALMFAHPPYVVKSVKLTDDDIVGVRKLYGETSTTTTATATTAATTTTDTTTTATNTTDTTNTATTTTATTTTATTTTATTTIATTTTHPILSTSAASLCSDPSMDLIFGSGSELNVSFVFKGSFYWKLIKDSGKMIVSSGYPRKIRDDWKGLPDNLDAAFTWEMSTFFFKKNECWKFHHGLDLKDHPKYEAVPYYPKNIKKEFPGIPDDLDAAFVWGENKNFYFFKESKYWLFDPGTGQARAKGYPRSISRWGVPNNIEGALLHSNGRTYFFKDGLYWRFNDVFKIVEPKYPQKTAEWWFGCKEEKSGALVKNISLW